MISEMAIPYVLKKIIMEFISIESDNIEQRKTKVQCMIYLFIYQLNIICFCPLNLSQN